MSDFTFYLRKAIFKTYLLFPLNKPVYQVIKGFGLPSYRIRRLLRFQGVFTLKVDDKLSIRLRNYGNTIENELFWRGVAGWEEQSVGIWKELCKKSDVIFDVGANNGLYSLVAGKANPAATIHAFEPLAPIFNRLKENIDLNGVKVNLHRIALGDAAGEVNIYAARTVSDTFDQASLNENHFKGKKVLQIPIVIKKMSSVIEDNRIDRIDLMKIDVETFEPNVLAGMGDFLKKYRPTMLVEVLNEKVGEQVFQLVKDCQYKFYRIDEKKGYELCQDLTPLKRGNNFLLLNTDKHAELK